MRLLALFWADIWHFKQSNVFVLLTCSMFLSLVDLVPRAGKSSKFFNDKKIHVKRLFSSLRDTQSMVDVLNFLNIKYKFLTWYCYQIIPFQCQK